MRLMSAPVADAGNVLRSLQSAHQALINQRAHIESHIQSLEGMIRSVASGTANGLPNSDQVSTSVRSPGRSPSGTSEASYRPGSLKDIIHRVLASGDPMKVADIAEAVVKVGSKTKNKTLPNSVSIALSDMMGVRKISRGTYRLS